MSKTYVCLHDGQRGLLGVDERDCEGAGGLAGVVGEEGLQGVCVDRMRRGGRARVRLCISLPAHVHHHFITM